jgi:hypothetical protein
VSVIDAIGCARLAQHPRAQVRLPAQVWSYQLYCHYSIDEYVTCPVHDAHTTFANARFESVPTGNDFTQGRIVRGPTA